MALRDFLNEILLEIDTESLTDLEYAALPEGLTSDVYNLANYEALKATLQERESVSGKLERLRAFFIGKGAVLTGTTRDPASQIFLGCALD